MMGALFSCKPVDTESASSSNVSSAPPEEYRPKVEPASELAAVGLADKTGYIDFRAVGDSGWANVKTKNPPASTGFVAGLNDFDPGKEMTKGHINFINWETTVSSGCLKWFDVDYPFLGDSESVRGAIDWGYNLFSLANNHAEDCEDDGQGRNGALSTREIFDQVTTDKKVVYSGVGLGAELRRIKELNLNVDGQNVKIAFAALAFQSWWTDYTSRFEYHGDKILEAFKSSDADIKILSIHTEGFLKEARYYSSRFINEADGGIAILHGSHTWDGVKVFKKPNGDTGIVFHGLGNFVHNQVGHNPNNLIGRVLLDKKSFKIVQVQAIPVENWVGGKDVILKRDFKLPSANFEWNTYQDEGVKKAKIGFFNLR